MVKIVDISNSEHYLWGDMCSGWHLLKLNELSIIEECMPPGKSEARHFHHAARQFFYILAGEATIEIDSCDFQLKSQQGIEVPPKIAHQFRNQSDAEVRFLVVSVPKAHGDRVDL